MKQITNEEAYKAYCNCVIGQNADYVNKNHLIVKAYFEQQEKKDKLLDLYKELSILRIYLFCETDYDLGQELMDKNDLINKQIKALEEEIK